MERKYLFDTIYEYSALQFCKELDAMNGKSMELRIMTKGGYTDSGSAIMTAITEYKGDINMSVVGDTASMGALIVLYSKYTKMANSAELMFHKAAFPKWYEPTETQKENLKRENIRFRAKLSEKVGDAGKWLVEKVFDSDERTDVYLTAKEAKDLGLVNEIIEVTPEEKQAFQTEYAKLMLHTENKENKQSNLINNKKMEYTEKDIQDAREQGRKEAREKIMGWMPFFDVDKEACMTGIKSGEAISEESRSEFLIKVASKNVLKEAIGESAAPTSAAGGNKAEKETPEQKAEKEAKEEFMKKFLGE